MPSKTASNMVSSKAKSWNPADVTDISKDFKYPSTSTATNFAKPVKFKHTSITVTARNIRYSVDTVTPAWAKPSKIFLGCVRSSLSRNINTSNNATAHQPAALASPAAFWKSSTIHGLETTLQVSPLTVSNIDLAFAKRLNIVSTGLTIF